ncbi:hypothetical protein [Serratia aquatilis]|uniref:Uncharacterized protein n=1 Tax=Serratia aquatilis TaxID=1737515 RepID=A0ABV6EHH3_9GAMM
MKLFSRHSFALCSLIVPVWANATLPLPQPIEVQEAIGRTLDTIEIPIPDTDDRKARTAYLIQKSSIESVRSAEVLQISGCVSEGSQKINCIIQMDYGTGIIPYISVPLEYKNNQWEAPIFATIMDQEPDWRLPVPAPTLEQAQKVAKQFAEKETDEDSKLLASGLIKIVSLKQDCQLDKHDGTVSCESKISRRETKEQQEVTTELMIEFHLKGSEWQFGRAPRTEKGDTPDN